MVVGQFVEEQYTAAQLLNDADNPKSYDWLKTNLGIEDKYPNGARIEGVREYDDAEAVMQAVMRGLSDNGVLNPVTTEQGGRKYNTRRNPDDVYAAVKG